MPHRNSSYEALKLIFQKSSKRMLLSVVQQVKRAKEEKQLKRDITARRIALKLRKTKCVNCPNTFSFKKTQQTMKNNNSSWSKSVVGLIMLHRNMRLINEHLPLGVPDNTFFNCCFHYLQPFNLHITSIKEDKQYLNRIACNTGNSNTRFDDFWKLKFEKS